MQLQAEKDEKETEEGVFLQTTQHTDYRMRYITDWPYIQWFTYSEKLTCTPSMRCISPAPRPLSGWG